MRKRSKWALLGLTLALVGAGRMAWAMAGEHGKGDPKHPISVSTWPAGVTTLANRADRVSGRWINASDWFYYVDDTNALNDFLKQYAKVPSAFVILEAGTDPLFSTCPPNCSWEMNVMGWGKASASVRVHIGGSISLQALRVPPEVSVSVTDTADKTLRAFLDAHKAKQAKALLERLGSSKPAP